MSHVCRLDAETSMLVSLSASRFQIVCSGFQSQKKIRPERYDAGFTCDAPDAGFDAGCAAGCAAGGAGGGELRTGSERGSARAGAAGAERWTGSLLGSERCTGSLRGSERGADPPARDSPRSMREAPPSAGGVYPP